MVSFDAENRAARRWCAWLLTFAALCYVYWPIGLLLNSGLDQRDGYISELSAIDQPYSLLFRALDLLSGAATGIAAVTWWLAWRMTTGRRRYRLGAVEIVGWTALALFGLSTMAGAAFAMDCAPFIDTTCALNERAGQLSAGHDIHAVVSVVAFGAIGIAALAQTYTVRRLAPMSLLARMGYPWLVVFVAVSFGSLVLLYDGHWLGVAQRVQITWITSWLVLLAWHVSREHQEIPGDGVSVPADTHQLLTVNGARIHVASAGEGIPVLMLAGLAGAWFDWNEVARRLVQSGEFRALRMDRPGLGGSPRFTGSRTLTAEVDRIAAMVRALDLEGVVVVAHSVAGVHAEAFARRYPTLVTGVVLVDSSCEPRIRPPGPIGRVSTWGACLLAPLFAGLVGGLGLVRGFGPWLRTRIIRAQSGIGDEPGTPQQVRRVYGSIATFTAAMAERLAYRSWLVELAQLRETTPYPDVATVVLTGGDPGSDAEKARVADERWRANHAQLAGLLDARHRVLPDARHMVQLDRPDAVVEAVVQVVAAGLGPAVAASSASKVVKSAAR